MSSSLLKKDPQIVHIMISIFTFQDDGIWFQYSPDLDLTGYGKTQTEAEDSFKVAFAELMRYAKNKGTEPPEDPWDKQKRMS